LGGAYIADVPKVLSGMRRKRVDEDRLLEKLESSQRPFNAETGEKSLTHKASGEKRLETERLVEKGSFRGGGGIRAGQ